LVADRGDYGVFLRRTIGHEIDGGGASSAAAIPPPIAPANRVETVWDRGRRGREMVEAVAAKDALLAAWIGIPARIFLRRFRFIPV
jgi:hypothetical protein